MQAAKIMTAQLAISAQAADGKLITATGARPHMSGSSGAKSKTAALHQWAPMQLTAVSIGLPTALPKAVGAFLPWGHALGALGNR